jgi:hypothetical protein
MVFGIAFLLLSFSDGLVQKAQGAAISGIADEMDSPPPVPAQEQPEILTRGPVHEAFAEPVALQTDEGLVTVKQPPVIINEILPSEKPAGTNFVWVPGYWSWDGDRNNYIWVSGCWRMAPPKMSWVPGYWTRVSAGWKWVSGFWMQTGDNEIEYLKAPPATVDIEPPGLPPTECSIWVPGCWYWTNDRYVSRPGYWLQGQTGWVWTPSHYVWTPRGYVFSNGRWDYTLERRGVLYAPVYFPSSVVYTRPGYSYSLGVTVDLGLLKVNMFCYPRYSHYYFGDYYDDAFIRVGIFPCFESGRRHVWYDPIYQYDRWHSRDSRWDEHARNSYELRRNDRDLRPPKTYREQESRMSGLPEKQRDNFQIARPSGAGSSEKSANRRFEQTDSDTRRKFSKQSNDVQNFREERRQWESTDISSRGNQSSVERTKDGGGKSVQSPEGRGDSAGQSDRGKDTSYKSTQKTVDRSDSAGQSERNRDYSREAQTSDNHSGSTGRSERVRVPDSPVYDRGSSSANGDRYPSTPSEERRGQDYGRDSRGDNGQRGGGRSR